MSSERSFARRQVLAAGAAGVALAACRSADTKLARPAQESGRALLVLEMFGGNDGLSTLVPHQDDAYHRARPTLRMERAETLEIDAERGLHPVLTNLHRLYHDGHVAAVEGVGLPEPIYSHFRAQEVWHTARAKGRASGPGWIARVREDVWGADDDRMLVVHIGGDMPYSVWSDRHPAVSVRVAGELDWIGGDAERRAVELAAAAECEELERSRRDRMVSEVRARLEDSLTAAARLREVLTRYRPRVEYPAEPFAHALRAVAAILNSDERTRVFSVVLSNFDTHGAVQKTKHARLLAQWDRALGAFFADLRGTAADERLLVLAWSEFGRRVAENASHGTDHGAAGPAFLLGRHVRGGLHGRHPSLTRLDANGNLVSTVDYRRLYATCLESWLGVPSRAILDGDFEPLALTM